VIDPRDVTACLVTRGDQPEMMARIRESLVFDHGVVWDNSQREDWKCAGRYKAAERARTDVVYFQDDDVIVPRETQKALLAEYDGEDCLAVYAHGDEPAGYDDLPLIGCGALVNRHAAQRAIDRYAGRWPLDDDFRYEADFVVGVLYGNWRHLHAPFNIEYEIATDPSRLARQPWQRSLKFEITNRARRIRDNDDTREYADWYLENCGVPA
jgi:hypothetical protein